MASAQAQPPPTALAAYTRAVRSRRPVLVIFYRGERSRFCRAWLRRWLTVPALDERLAIADATLLFVSAQSQGKAYSVAAGFRRDGTVGWQRVLFLGDPTHDLARHLSERGLVHPIVTNPDGHRAHAWVYDYGMVQPAVLAVAGGGGAADEGGDVAVDCGSPTNGESVLFHWSMRPSFRNAGGKLERPDPWEVWDFVERKLDRIKFGTVETRAMPRRLSSTNSTVARNVPTPKGCGAETEVTADDCANGAVITPAAAVEEEEGPEPVEQPFGAVPVEQPFVRDSAGRAGPEAAIFEHRVFDDRARPERPLFAQEQVKDGLAAGVARVDGGDPVEVAGGAGESHASVGEEQLCLPQEEEEEDDDKVFVDVPSEPPAFEEAPLEYATYEPAAKTSELFTAALVGGGAREGGVAAEPDQGLVPPDEPSTPSEEPHGEAYEDEDFGHVQRVQSEVIIGCEDGVAESPNEAGNVAAVEETSVPDANESGAGPEMLASAAVSSSLVDPIVLSQESSAVQRSSPPMVLIEQSGTDPDSIGELSAPGTTEEIVYEEVLSKSASSNVGFVVADEFAEEMPQASLQQNHLQPQAVSASVGRQPDLEAESSVAQPENMNSSTPTHEERGSKRASPSLMASSGAASPGVNLAASDLVQPSVALPLSQSSQLPPAGVADPIAASHTEGSSMIDSTPLRSVASMALKYSPAGTVQPAADDDVSPEAGPAMGAEGSIESSVAREKERDVSSDTLIEAPMGDGPFGNVFPFEDALKIQGQTMVVDDAALDTDMNACTPRPHELSAAVGKSRIRDEYEETLFDDVYEEYAPIQNQSTTPSSGETATGSQEENTGIVGLTQRGSEVVYDEARTNVGAREDGYYPGAKDVPDEEGTVTRKNTFGKLTNRWGSTKDGRKLKEAPADQLETGDNNGGRLTRMLSSSGIGGRSRSWKKQPEPHFLPGPNVKMPWKREASQEDIEKPLVLDDIQGDGARQVPYGVTEQVPEAPCAFPAAGVPVPIPSYPVADKSNSTPADGIPKRAAAHSNSPVLPNLAATEAAASSTKREVDDDPSFGNLGREVREDPEESVGKSDKKDLDGTDLDTAFDPPMPLAFRKAPTRGSLVPVNVSELFKGDQQTTEGTNVPGAPSAGVKVNAGGAATALKPRPLKSLKLSLLEDEATVEDLSEELADSHGESPAIVPANLAIVKTDMDVKDSGDSGAIASDELYDEADEATAKVSRMESLSNRLAAVQSRFSSGVKGRPGSKEARKRSELAHAEVEDDDSGVGAALVRTNTFNKLKNKLTPTAKPGRVADRAVPPSPHESQKTNVRLSDVSSETPDTPDEGDLFRQNSVAGRVRRLFSRRAADGGRHFGHSDVELEERLGPVESPGSPRRRGLWTRFSRA